MFAHTYTRIYIYRSMKNIGQRVVEYVYILHKCCYTALTIICFLFIQHHNRELSMFLNIKIYSRIRM